MRIRKNKKLTASIIWSTAASSSSPNPPEELLQAHVCVVNRSPWDAPPSPPPPPPPPLTPFDYTDHQAIETDNDSYGLINGSLACDDSLPADKSTDSMKISSKSTIIPHSNEFEAAQNSPTVDHSAAMEASHPPPKRRPGRPRKVPAAQPANPVLPRTTTPSNPEFYYYSGFGPRWGKRRGADEDNDQNHQKNKTKSSAVDQKKKNHSNNNNANGRSCSSSSCSPSLIDETDDELDFLDLDDDDDDGGGRKRMRKPVKARSLKSLIM